LNKTIVVGALVALAVGLSIGLQSSFIERSGQVLGPVRTGLMYNFVAGVFSGLALIPLIIGPGVNQWQLPRTIVTLVLIAGVLASFTIVGFAFALQRIGISAALSAFILGQMTMGTLADTLGWGINEAIPLNRVRILGLILMGAAVFLLLPRR
jgi:uncharacterized membrane protein YdcZ (DUF606 family)